MDSNGDEYPLKMKKPKLLLKQPLRRFGTSLTPMPTKKMQVGTYKNKTYEDVKRFSSVVRSILVIFTKVHLFSKALEEGPISHVTAPRYRNGKIQIFNFLVKYWKYLNSLVNYTWNKFHSTNFFLKINTLH